MSKVIIKRCYTTCKQTKRGPGRENWGWTPLQIAAAYGMEDVVECLVGAWVWVHECEGNWWVLLVAGGGCMGVDARVGRELVDTIGKRVLEVRIAHEDAALLVMVVIVAMEVMVIVMVIAK